MRVIDLMNELQAEGVGAFQTLAVVAYALGAALAQRGVVLQLDGALRHCLPPLAAGYEAAQREDAPPLQ